MEEKKINDILGVSVSNNEQMEPQTILNKESCYKDIRTIRLWVQFFGWLTIVSIVISIIVTVSIVE